MSDTVDTPWGPADTLPAQRLRPGPGIPREQVERNHRERLFGAMVAVVDEHGYDGMSVGELAARAGVSRSTIYEYFEDRDDCFLATFDALIAAGMERIDSAFDDEGSWDERLRAVLETLIAIVVEQPAAARLCLLEVYAAGPGAVVRRERAAAGIEALARRGMERSPERVEMPADVVRAIVGGLRTVIQRRLRAGTEQELPGMIDELWQWVVSYRSPEPPLREVPATPARRARRAEPSGSLERLFEAVARVVSEKGYAEMTVGDVVTDASMSLSTFYSHFPGKEAAFLAACEAAVDDTIETGLRTFREHDGDWPERVHAGLRDLLEYLARRPEATHMTTVELFAAGGRAQGRRDDTMDLFVGKLAPGDELVSGDVPIVLEATGGALYTLFYSQIAGKGAARLREILPTATFVALAPFVGNEAAAEMANGD
ncbi:MAG TPA: TetR/AcrR family transcriptional regulator [Thermoleophilaceae bacterium]|nr:TetR/AcrR family transcriptional regulator [Thermoleophilaceae bacterium]